MHFELTNVECSQEVVISIRCLLLYPNPFSFTILPLIVVM